MYTLLISDSAVLPTVMSRSDLNFPSMIMAGYESVFDGTKQQCEAEQERRISGIVSNMDSDFWAISLEQ